MGPGWRMGIVMIVCAGAAPAHAWQSDARFNVEFETGAVWQSRNEIQIPDSADGTRFDLRRLQGSGPEAHRRVELTWNPAHRHSLRFVYAPLAFSGSGSLESPVRFAGSTFAPGTATDSDYRLTPIASPIGTWPMNLIAGV